MNKKLLPVRFPPITVPSFTVGLLLVRVVIGSSEVDTSGSPCLYRTLQFLILCVIVLWTSTPAWIVVLVFLIHKQNINILPTWKVTFHYCILLVVGDLLLFANDLILIKFLPTSARGGGGAGWPAQPSGDHSVCTCSTVKAHMPENHSCKQISEYFLLVLLSV